MNPLAHTPTPPSRWTALAGPAAAALLLGGLWEDNVPTSSGDAEIGAWLAGAGNTGWMLHTLTLVAGGLLVAVFAQVLRGLLAPGDEGLVARLLGAAGTTCGSMAVTGAALFGAVPVGRLFEGSPDPSADTYRYLMAASVSVLVIFVAVPAAGLCGTAAVLVLRRGTAPAWLGWTSVVLTVLLVVSALVAPLVVFGLWLTLTGVVLALRGPQPTTAPASGSMPATLAVEGAAGR